MNQNTHQFLQSIAIRKYQENRRMNTDYVDAFSPEPSRAGLWMRALIGRVRKVKQRDSVYQASEATFENC